MFHLRTIFQSSSNAPDPILINDDGNEILVNVLHL